MSARPGIDEAQRRRIESPCVGVCMIDEDTGLCEGCLRTLDEIAAWGGADAAQRRRILDAVARRTLDGADSPG